MKKIISYLYPLTEKMQSAINGKLEITWYNGKKMLDSKNANYSYGSLQRVLKFGLEQINLRSVNNVLLLGLGGGCVIKTLREDFDFKNKITAVEIDPVMIDIAKTEFDIFASENLQIVNDDAFNFVITSTQKSGLIIIDLFIDIVVPDIFFSPGFWNRIADLTETGGYVIFNASTSDLAISKSDLIIENLKPAFQFQKFERVKGSNTLLIGKKLATGETRS